MLKINTEIIIDATPEKVWSMLVDFKKYPEWNPFIKSITGTLKIGEKLHVKFEKMKFNPKVLELLPNKKLKWLGHLWFKGLFDGFHSFTLVEENASQTKLIHQEEFSGILVPFFKRKLFTETKSNFNKMNVALKSRVEKAIQ